VGPSQLVAQHLLAGAVEHYAAAAIAAETGLGKSQVHSALHYYVDIGAIEKLPAPGGRVGSVYRIVDRSELERRTDGRARRAFSEELLDEAPPLSFFIDGDGDLQLVREGEEPVLIRNVDARRLVAFVATQATAILTAGV
jgi:hypothetical protein